MEAIRTTELKFQKGERPFFISWQPPAVSLHEFSDLRCKLSFQFGPCKETLLGKQGIQQCFAGTQEFNNKLKIKETPNSQPIFPTKHLLSSGMACWELDIWTTKADQNAPNVMVLRRKHLLEYWELPQILTISPSYLSGY